MDIYEEISKVAYELYEKSGYAEGHDQENWLEAEKIVLERRSSEGNEIERPSQNKKMKMLRNQNLKARNIRYGVLCGNNHGNEEIRLRS